MKVEIEMESEISNSIINNMLMSDGNNDMSTYDKYENGENKYIAVDGILNKNSISAISNVVHIEFGKAVTKISANTFNNAGEYKLSSIFFSNYTISSIGLCALYNCNNLIFIDGGIIQSISDVEDYAFANCRSLNSISIGTLSVSNNMFENCTNLKTVNIASSLNTIGNDAFKGCSGLSSITIHIINSWCNTDFKNEDS